MNNNIKQLQNIVREVAQTTLMPLYHRVQTQYKQDGSIVTQADRQVQLELTAALQAAYPDIALLGEEMPLQQQQDLLQSGQPFWCLDPIDGTSNFATDMPYFSVSLALIENDETRLGLVYDPVREECFSAIAGEGAWLNDNRLTLKPCGLTLGQTVALVDFKRLPVHVRSHLVTEQPFGSQRNLGSIALELSWIAAGRAHIYLHGSQHLWDVAAAQLVIREAGGYLCQPDASPVMVNSLNKQACCAAVDKPLFKTWLNYLQRIPYVS